MNSEILEILGLLLDDICGCDSCLNNLLFYLECYLASVKVFLRFQPVC